MKIGLVIFIYLPRRDALDDKEVHQRVMFNDTGVLYLVHAIFLL
jgi:hypothetical protein